VHRDLEVSCTVARRCFNPKKVLKVGRRRPFISVMNSAANKTTTECLPTFVACKGEAADRHYVVDRTNGVYKMRRSTFTYLPGNTETCGGLTKEEAEDLAYDMDLLGL
jgi:hypothetical protein